MMGMGGGGVVNNAYVQAWLDRGTALSYNLPIQSDIDTLNTKWDAIVSGGFIPYIDVFYQSRGCGSIEMSTLNFLDPANHQATLVNSPSWTNADGWSFNGTSSYVNTNFSPSLDATKAVDADQSFIYEMRTLDSSPNSTTYYCGTRDNLGGFGFLHCRMYDVNRGNIGFNGGAVFSPNYSAGKYYSVSALGADIRRYVNGVFEGLTTLGTPHLSQGVIPIGCTRTNNGGGTNFVDNKCSIYIFGTDAINTAGFQTIISAS